jgi:hypothetical protein
MKIRGCEAAVVLHVKLHLRLENRAAPSLLVLVVLDEEHLLHDTPLIVRTVDLDAAPIETQSLQQECIR